MTKMKYKSDVPEAIHSSANALFKVGAIDSTLRNFDDACLTFLRRSSPSRSQIRSKTTSANRFCPLSEYSESTVQKGEGAKRPSGMAIKLPSIAKYGIQVLS